MATAGRSLLRNLSNTILSSSFNGSRTAGRGRLLFSTSSAHWQQPGTRTSSEGGGDIQAISGEQEDGASSSSGSFATTNKLEFIEPTSAEPVPAYRVLREDGSLAHQLDPSLTPDRCVELYRAMVKLNTMDKIMFDSHRQGRISFYMTSYGEEAVQLGSAGALEPRDWVYAQYREAGVLIERKMALRLLMAQCYGNREDLGKGRQMPIHYGSRHHNYVTVSSPLATQMPQAAGTAYAFKRDPEASRRIVACYFGEGAASEGDAHAAMNFAATLECPVLFLCRNNGYAISTPSAEQYRGDGIVSRGLAYGISSIRVDGNDLFAVYAATKAARRLCSATGRTRPVLLEAMTYRLGHHSTSDDSSAYRSSAEARDWEQRRHPMVRVYKYLVAEGLWSEQQETEARAEARAEIIEAFNWAEKQKKPSISSMFEDVYDEMPANLRRQQDELRRHLEEFGVHYPVNEFDRAAGDH